MSATSLILSVLLACEGGKGQDTDSGTSSAVEVVLEDADLASLDFAWTVQSRPLMSGDEGVLDWSGLSADARGIAMDPVTDVRRIVLVQFQKLGLDEILPALATGELSQQSVTLQVDCSSKEGRCALSEFRFEAGHPIDLGETFLVGSGTWLAWVVDQDAGEPRALVQLEPTDGGPAEAVWANEDSDLSVAGWTDPSTAVVLPADGAASVRWGDLSRSSQGGSLSPLRLDQGVLARTAEGADMSSVLLDLSGRAEQSYTANLSGVQTLSLDAFTDSSGAAFAGFEGEGQWWLALTCSTCAGSQPAALFAIEPQ